MQPTLQHFSSLPLDPNPLGIIFLFPLFLSICGIFVTILEELELTLTSLDQAEVFRAQDGSDPSLFCLLHYGHCVLAGTFPCWSCSAAHVSFVPCTCCLHDFHEDLRGLFQANGFCDNTASDLCPQHLHYTFSTVHESFSSSISPSFSHHCVVCWADHLIHPTLQPLCLVIQGASDHWDQPHVIWIIKSLAHCRRSFGLVWGRSDPFAATATAAAGIWVMYVRDWSCLGVIKVTFLQNDKWQTLGSPKFCRH